MSSFLQFLGFPKFWSCFRSTFILPFSIFGPFLAWPVSKAFTLPCSAPRVWELLQSTGTLWIQRRKRPCPAALSAEQALFMSKWDSESVSFSKLPWLRVRNTNCRQVVLWARPPRHGQGQLQWPLGSQPKPPCCAKSGSWAAVATRQHLPARENAGENWLVPHQRNVGHESVTLQLLHCKMQYTGDVWITELKQSVCPLSLLWLTEYSIVFSFLFYSEWQEV